MLMFGVLLFITLFFKLLLGTLFYVVQKLKNFDFLSHCSDIADGFLWGTNNDNTIARRVIRLRSTVCLSCVMIKSQLF